MHDLSSRTALASVVGLAIANTGLVLRLIARWVGHIRPTVDDYLMLIALVFYWGIAMGGLILVDNGVGQPLAKIPPAHIVVFLKVQYAGSFIYTLTVAFTKLSILAMYWRILPSANVRRMVYICGGLVLAWTVGTCITGAIACLPVYKLWTPGIKGRCIDFPSFYYGIQIPNILTDIFIVVIPIREIFGLNFTKMQKYSLIAIFGIATLTVIFDIVRLVAMIEFANSEEDFTIAIIDTTLWTSIEPAIGIFAACLSNLRPLFKRASVHAHNFRLGSSRKVYSSGHTTESQEGTLKGASSSGSQSIEEVEAYKMQPVVTTVERRKSAITL